jgi:pimeloyl-ACP methyl ester carboxylesterase
MIIALLGLGSSAIAQETQNTTSAGVIDVSSQDAELLARVSSREGMATSPELRSLLDRFATVGEFGRIAYRAPLPSANPSATPIVLFHSVFGGTSHRDFRELLSQLDQAGAPVYIMDLPGIGRSFKPKTVYSIEKIDRFIEQFLSQVVTRQAHVVAAGVPTLSTLRVAATKPNLIKTLVLLSPTGVKNFTSPPLPAQTAFYTQILSTDDVATWLEIVTPEGIRPFIDSGFSQASYIEANRNLLIEEGLIQRSNLDQRWITYAFGFGQLFRTFQSASIGVKRPVLGIFGADYKTFVSPDPNDPLVIPAERASEFQQIRPEFQYLEIPNASGNVYREQAAAVAQAIVDFSCKGNCKQ